MEKLNEILGLGTLRSLWAGIVRSFSSPWSNTLVGPVDGPDTFDIKSKSILSEMTSAIHYRTSNSRVRDNVSMTVLFLPVGATAAEWHSVTIWGAIGKRSMVDLAIFASDKAHKKFYPNLKSDVDTPLVHIRHTPPKVLDDSLSAKKIWDSCYAPAMDKAFANFFLLSIGESTTSGAISGVVRPMKSKGSSKRMNYLSDIARMLEGRANEN